MRGPKPHRLDGGPRAGQCRDCGTYDMSSAPLTCCRCALERYGALGHEIIVNPVAQFVHVNDEMWRQVTQDLSGGVIRSDRFYIYIGHNDGGPLTLPAGGVAGFEAEGWATPDAPGAHVSAKYLLENRYPQAWVVTTVGCWNVAPPKGA